MSTQKQRKEGTGHGVELKDRQSVEPPKKFKVILHNDDYTPMEFVVDVLMDVFNYGAQKANQVMLQVHEQGKGIAGVYPKEIAWMRTKKCNKYAQQQGHPLLVTMEAE
jgi:ATP-dependent Clp protease adaptor protein ClpS